MFTLACGGGYVRNSGDQEVGNTIKIKSFDMKKIIKGTIVLISLTFIGLSNVYGSPYILECVQCPSGCAETQIDMCFTSCSTCDCCPGSQGACGCPNQ